MKQFLPQDLKLEGKSVLITGGTGSFGRKFVDHLLLKHNPERVVVFSRDELKQYEMAQKYDFKRYPNIRYFIGDVRDRTRLSLAMRDIDYVIHAAALKQVPTAEYNPMECIKTNVNGAENVVMAALENAVEKVVALSTDKAANPINLYGASKLASDKIFVAANNLAGKRPTKFSVVRYGNVVGSRGSVIPFFQNLVAEGANSLPITDPRMTRFWITLHQGINFVLSSLEMMRGGEIFVPRIPSMKITDLAEAVAPGLKHEVVGIRPGEKLHEVMVPSDDARNTMALEDRFIIEPSFPYKDISHRTYRGEQPSPAEDDFVYSSDQNDEWLDTQGLHKLLGEDSIAA